MIDQSVVTLIYMWQSVRKFSQRRCQLYVHVVLPAARQVSICLRSHYWLIMRSLHTSVVCGHAGRTPDQSISLVSQLLAAGVAVYRSLRCC